MGLIHRQGSFLSPSSDRRWRPTIRFWLVAVALISLGLSVTRQRYFANTVYAAGFSEDRLSQVRPGMTTGEVETLLGPPLRVVHWSTPGLVNWMYSDCRPGASDYWMRDIFFQDGRVDRVIRIYWVD